MAQFVLIIAKISIVVLVFSLALNARSGDVFSLLRKSTLLLRSLLAMNVIMPLVAVGFVIMLQLHEGLEFVLVALAISPIPPLLPMKQVRAGGESSYATSLLVIAGLLSVAFVPTAVALLGLASGRPAHMPIALVAATITLTVLGPLLAGLGFSRWAPALSRSIARPLMILAGALLGLCLVVILIALWPLVISLIGNGTIAAIVGFVMIGLAVGHVLGGPDANDRTVLALATANRHPGVAVAIASVNAAAGKTALAAILLYLIVGALVSAPYTMWRKRKHGSSAV